MARKLFFASCNLCVLSLTSGRRSFFFTQPLQILVIPREMRYVLSLPAKMNSKDECTPTWKRNAVSSNRRCVKVQPFKARKLEEQTKGAISPFRWDHR